MDRPVGSGYGSGCTFSLAAVNYQYVVEHIPLLVEHVQF